MVNGNSVVNFENFFSFPAMPCKLLFWLLRFNECSLVVYGSVFKKWMNEIQLISSLSQFYLEIEAEINQVQKLNRGSVLNKYQTFPDST